jgi:CheY-like chemotaxis protein
LINLLSNAIKFTKQGEVRLRIRASDKLHELSESTTQQLPSSLTQQILFEIEDTGVGIGPEAIEQVFEAFTQPSSGILPQEGTGLGLAISQKFVGLMGGEISVRSIPGQGTAFSFDICVPVVETVGREALTFPGPVITPDPDTPQYRVLVVDDIWDNRQLLTILMKQFNFEVQEADTGTKAFELWKSWRPHLIWLDIRMPGSMDGHDVARNIRALEAQEASAVPNDAEPKRTCIIAVTAGVLEESHAPVVHPGCDDVLSKPYRSTDVFALVEKYLGVKVEYARPPALEPENTGLTPELITTLPGNLQEDLRNAVESINLNAMYALIYRIRKHSPLIADQLESLTKSYRFDTLQALVEDIR